MQNSWLLNFFFPCNTLNASLSSCLHGFWQDIWFSSYCCWSIGKLIPSGFMEDILCLRFSTVWIWCAQGSDVWYLYCLMFPETPSLRACLCIPATAQMVFCFFLLCYWFPIMHVLCLLQLSQTGKYFVHSSFFSFAYWLQKFLLTCL